MAVNKEELTRMGLVDFRVFVGMLWRHLGLPKPTALQLNMAHYLQHGPDFSMIQAFRGAAKTWLTGAYVGWSLLWNPEMKIMLVSASQGHADGLSLFIKGMLEEVDVLQHLAGGRRWANDKFDVRGCQFDPSPSVKSVGLKGQLTGSRADLIVPDDIEVPTNSLTQHMREDTRNRVKEFRSVLKPHGKIKYLGTPQLEDTLYNELPRLGYDLQIWPARVPGSRDEWMKEFTVLENREDRLEFGDTRGRNREMRCALAPMIQRMIDDPDVLVGTPTEPTVIDQQGHAVPRFDEHELSGRELEYGRAGFQLQFMLNTQAASAEQHPLKLRNLIVDSLDHEMAHVKYVWGNQSESVMHDSPLGFEGDRCYHPVWRSNDMTKYTGTVMVIDPSGKGKDETAYTVMKALYGYLFVMEVGGFQDGFAESTLQGLAERAVFWGVHDVVAEANYGGGMFTALLMPKLRAAGCKAAVHDPVAGHAQKERRICDVLEPLMGSHRLIFSREVIENDTREAQAKGTTIYSLLYQLTRMTRNRGALAHDDRIETIQMAASFFEDRVKIETNKGVERHRKKEMDKEIKSWMKEVPGRSVTLGLEKHIANRKRIASRIWRRKPRGVK